MLLAPHPNKKQRIMTEVTTDCGKTETFLTCQCCVSEILQPYQTPGK